jgi:O-antigen/teichoic acid export membrane protein
LGPAVTVYLLAQVVVSFVAASCLFPYKGAFTFLKRIVYDRSVLKELARVGGVYSNFPRYQMGAQISIALSYQMPIFFLRIFFSDAWAGWYFMSSRLLSAPTNLVSQAVGQLFYRDSAEKFRSNLVQSHSVENIVSGLIRISLLPTMLLAVLVWPLVDQFFGKSWLPLAPIIQISLPAVLANFVTGTISPYLNVKGKQAAALAFCIAIMFARLLGLVAGVWQDSAIMSVAGYSLGTFIAYFLYCGYIVRVAGGSFVIVLKRVLPHSIEAGGISVLAIVLSILGLLYSLMGFALMAVGVGVVLWREYQRGGFRLVHDLSVAGTGTE